MYILDTNIILRTLIREDPKSNEECKKILEKIREGELNSLIPGIVIAEAVWVMKMSYNIEKESQVKAVKSIIHLKHLEVVDEYNYENAVSLYKNTKVKFVDCLIATQAIKHAATIISYDKELKKLPVKWATPTELLKTLK